MKILCIAIICFLSQFSKAYSQLNVELLHQLVAESKSEYSVQDAAKNKQAATSVNEEVNKTQLSKLKSKYRELQSRYKTLGTAIDAAQIGLQATPIVNDIIKQQGLIFQLAGEDPVLIAFAATAEISLVDQAYLLSNYLYGLLISIGDLNQMKPSDRKMLFGFVISELKRIDGASRGLSTTMYYSNRKRMAQSLNPFGDFVNQDRQLVESIKQKIKILKN